MKATEQIVDKISENCKVKNQVELDSMIKENVYQTVLYGVPFRLADQYAFATKQYSYNDPRRLLGALCEVEVNRLSQGHTFLGALTDKRKQVHGQTVLLNKPNTHAAVTKILNHSSDLFPQQSKLWEWYEDVEGNKIPRLDQNLYYSVLEKMNDIKLFNRKMFQFSEYEGRQRLIHLPTYFSEYQIAERIVTLLKSEKRFKTPKDVAEIRAIECGADAEQAAAISEVFSNKVSIITGGPGTGKSKAIEVLVELLLEEDSSYHIRICAPTGVAAQNLQNRLISSKSNKVRRYFTDEDHKCRTMHHLLKIRPSKSIGVMRTEYSYVKNPLDADILIIEETSMSDIYLMRSALWAIPNYAHVVIVGDVDQLNSVGPGRVLYDLTEGLKKLQQREIVPLLPKWSQLKRIHRTEESSRIPLLFQMLKIEDPDERWRYFKKELDNCIKKGDVKWIHTETNDILEKTVQTYLDEYKKDKDIALITTRHEEIAGRIPLNEEIQLKLMNTIGFAKGVPIIQNRNNHTEGVMNGERGLIIESKKNLLTAKFSNDRTMTLSRNQAEEDWLIGYATTVHKSQGTEAKTVLLPIWSEEKKQIWTQSTLFTAMSRSKGILILVGDEDSLEKGVKAKSKYRYTRLPLCYRSVTKKLIND